MELFVNEQKSCSDDDAESSLGTIDLTVGTCGAIGFDTQHIWEDAMDFVGVVKVQVPSLLGPEILFCIGATKAECQANLDARVRSEAHLEDFEAPYSTTQGQNGC